MIDIIGQAQEDDGYLHTNIQIDGIKHFSNRRYHEMYNCGHLYTSASIHHRVTGKTNLLKIAIKNANLLYTFFQPQPKELSRFGFNQSQIMGLTELYRTIKKPEFKPYDATFIPYYAWSNRGTAEMTVFMPVIWG